MYLGNSQVLAIQISKEFRFNKKHKRFIFTINDIINNLNKYRFLSRIVKIGVKGKVHGKSRSKQFFVLKFFLLAKQTITKICDYSLIHCLTRFGIFGIRV
jgi:hypothetical protein